MVCPRVTSRTSPLGGCLLLFVYSVQHRPTCATTLGLGESCTKVQCWSLRSVACIGCLLVRLHTVEGAHLRFNSNALL
jgi:hypothetical protein